MSRLTVIRSFLTCLLVLGAGRFAWAKPPETPENIARGKSIYMKRCWFCHGREGDGNGPVADYLHPRPRDFTIAAYKFRTTQSGEVPLDEDLFRTITRGVQGTAMQSFEGFLTEDERWQVIYFIKTFAADLFEEPPVLAKIGTQRGSAEKGKEVYQKAKCWECHGQQGRGNGPSARKLKDDWEFPIRPLNLTQGWRYKGGNTVKDIFTRFTTGLDGSPMPSYIDTLSEQERWDLAAYVRSLIREQAATREPVVKSRRVDRDLPLALDDPLWQEAEALDVPLSGQVIVPPRWQNHSVDLITVRSLYNDKAIAFLLEWDDRFNDSVHKDEPLPTEDTYAKFIPDKSWTLRDAIEIQFPVRIPEGIDRPYFFLGQPRKPVVLWQWKADWNENPDRKTPVEELSATGPRKPVDPLPAEAQQVMGKGVWKDGRWQVVMTRPLAAKDPDKDISFRAGKMIPIAFHVWDGFNGERGLMGAVSSWQFLVLETTTPASVYLYAFLAMVGCFGAELWLIRWARSRSNGIGREPQAEFAGTPK
ncbi:MAG: ethylbenzene dehydrogenase-related protein [Candidatus Methylomirabilales bacterium]